MLPLARSGTALLGVLLLASSPAGDATPPADDVGQFPPGIGLGIVQASATPILLSLLKHLRSEAEQSSSQGKSVAQWCEGAKKFQAGLAEVLQRQRSEFSSVARQLGQESKRLESEEQLANLTNREKEKQLHDAAAIADFASGEFASEQRQAATTIDATRRAILLARSRSRRLAPGAPGGGPSFEERLGAAPQDAGGPARPQGLLRSLQRLEGGTETEQASAHQEQGAMMGRFLAFADHLGSSIMETQSQMAAFRIEAAQRRREQERLGGRLADLSALLDAVKAGEAATAGVCDEEGALKKEVAAFMSEESRRVANLLRQLRASDPFGAGAPGPEGESGTAGVDAAAAPVDAAGLPPSLLQSSSQHGGRVRRSGAARASGAAAQPAGEVGAEGLGRLLSALSSEGGQAEEGEAAEGVGGAARDLEQLVEADADAAEDEGSQDAPSSALKGIKQFVMSSTAAEAAGEGDRTSSAAREQERERERALARRRAGERQTQCSSILREGRKDLAALSRSLERASAKLSINKAAASEYEQASAYLQRQHKQLEALLGQLAALGKGTESWAAGSRPLLRGHAEQLMALATDLNEQLSVEEQGTTQAIRDLAQHVDGHQGALQRYADVLRTAQRSAEAAARTLSQRLAEDIQTSKRRLTRLQAEGQVLTSLAHAKAGVRAMSMRYQGAASSLCSKESIQRLGE